MGIDRKLHHALAVVTIDGDDLVIYWEILIRKEATVPPVD
jgi:hypothetical protein